MEIFYFKNAILQLLAFMVTWYAVNGVVTVLYAIVFDEESIFGDLGYIARIVIFPVILVLLLAGSSVLLVGSSVLLVLGAIALPLWLIGRFINAIALPVDDSAQVLPKDALELESFPPFANHAERIAERNRILDKYRLRQNWESPFHFEKCVVRESPDPRATDIALNKDLFRYFLRGNAKNDAVKDGVYKGIFSVSEAGRVYFTKAYRDACRAMHTDMLYCGKGDSEATVEQIHNIARRHLHRLWNTQAVTMWIEIRREAGLTDQRVLFLPEFEPEDRDTPIMIEAASTIGAIVLVVGYMIVTSDIWDSMVNAGLAGYCRMGG